MRKDLPGDLEANPVKRTRHILGLSGGKDSAALAVLLNKEIPDLEYFFCDTGKELPETYEYLDRIEARLGIRIVRLYDDRGFDHWLEFYGGLLPSPQVRWCTRQLKIRPLEKWVGDDEAISYIGIRADEDDREGYRVLPGSSRKITPVYPFRERGLMKRDIIQILEDSGIGLPPYHTWRSRSGCFFCFFQRKYEWVMLHEHHEDLFREAMRYEESHADGRRYYWNEDEPLEQLIARKDEIIQQHSEAMKPAQARQSQKTLAEVFDDVLDAEDDRTPCLVCFL